MISFDEWWKLTGPDICSTFQFEPITVASFAYAVWFACSCQEAEHIRSLQQEVERLRLLALTFSVEWKYGTGVPADHEARLAQIKGNAP